MTGPGWSERPTDGTEGAWGDESAQPEKPANPEPEPERDSWTAPRSPHSSRR
jgi:hypothetical protein